MILRGVVFGLCSVVAAMGCARTAPSAAEPAPVAQAAAPVAAPAAAPLHPCAGDADCAMTTQGEDCCSRCSPEVGTAAFIAARHRACAGSDKRAGHACKQLNCARDVRQPACVEGQCALR